MKLATVQELARGGVLPSMFTIGALSKAVYRVNFLASAGRSGLLRFLRNGPAGFDRIASELHIESAGYDGLEAWLKLGVRLGDLRNGAQGYRLGSRIARALARPDHDMICATLEEVARFHQVAVHDAPSLLRDGRRLTLADQDGEIIARSSRILEPLVKEAMAEVLPLARPARVLEVGCGAGGYMRYAAERNDLIQVDGVELQPDVAQLARANLRDWNLEGRCAVTAGDIRARAPEPIYDVVTMHNNIYYIPCEERVAVLAHVRGFLKDGGALLLTTSCEGGSVGLATLSLWFSLSEVGGRLPGKSELCSQLEAAGYRNVSGKSRLPGEAYYSFVGWQQPAES